MSKLQNKDEFQNIIHQNQGIFYKVSKSYCNDEMERQDLMQEMIIQVWNSYGNYKTEYKLSTWLYRIALNVAISFYRKKNAKKNQFSTVSIDDYQVIDESETIEKEANIQRLYQFIHELKELDRALILLYLDEKSYREIADILGITETNVATKTSRIKSILKQKFATA